MDEEHRPTTEQGRADKGGGPPTASRPLTRAEVEAILTELGAWKNRDQIRPLAKEDVFRLLKLNARSLGLSAPTGESLPLSRLIFEEEIDLTEVSGESYLAGPNFVGADLSGASFVGALLYDSDFSNADLQDACFEKAHLHGAVFQNTELSFTNFKAALLVGADLRDTNLGGDGLEGASLLNADLRDSVVSGDVQPGSLEGVIWDENFERFQEKEGWFSQAEREYSALKRAHQNAGIYDVADQFAYREQVVRKKQALKEKRWISWASLQFAELLFGYGYRWKRVVVSSAIALATFWLLYWLTGLGTPVGGPPPVLNALYFSAVSFTAVGYGGWVGDAALGWPKYLGALEAIIGVFLMALFLVTFTRQYLR